MAPAPAPAAIAFRHTTSSSSSTPQHARCNGPPSIAASASTKYPATEEEAREHVCLLVASSPRRGRHLHLYPTFDDGELITGRWLGTGGFSNVEELRAFNIQPAALERNNGPDSSVFWSTNSSGQINLSDATIAEGRDEDKNDSSETSGASNHNSEVIESVHSQSTPAVDVLEYETTSDVDDALSGDNHDTPRGGRLVGGRAAGSSAEPTRDSRCSPASPSLSRKKARFPGPTSSPQQAEEQLCRKFLVHHCTRESGDTRYAIKRLRREILHDPKRFPVGAMDLAVEAFFLADLQHPNVCDC
jgi:hypothetical protein